ncbi:beta strand repeat-containing protein, partial [Microseira wollei]|uniref:beta strand repeat-containing protein n=1 Tax=Microseira wollei TaxID=467598 RepID=UPI001CFE32EE
MMSYDTSNDPLALQNGDLLDSPLVTTNKSDYAPGETAVISGSGYAPNSTVEIKIADAPDDYGDDGDRDFYAPIQVTVDENGFFTVNWTVPTDNNGTGSGIPDALNATLNLTATGTGADGTFGTADDQVAMTTFTDAQLAVWAWRNQPGPTLNTWDAGTTIQQSNSVYAEGEVIPFRWTSTAGGGGAPNLVEGQTYTIQLDYAYAGGTTSPQKLFFDYLTSYNKTETTTVPFGPGSDLTGFQTGLVSTVAIPNDNGDTGGTPPNPATVPHTAGVFTLFNINPATVTFSPYIADPVNANQEDRQLNITFTPDDGDGILGETLNVGVAWGGHLATQTDYGFQNGAANFPGASPQMVVDFDPLTSGGLSNVNINPNAIVAQGQITIIKDAQPNSLQDFSFTLTRPDGTTTTFTLDDDSSVIGADSTYSNQQIFFGLPEGTYTITENTVSGWSLAGITPIENGAEDTTTGDIFTTNVGARTATVTVANGEVWTVTFTNQVALTPSFTITKTAAVADSGTTVDAAGDVINYSIVVDNTGDQNLTGVTVTDQVESYGITNATYVSGDANSNSTLDTTETWTYSATYTVTQADIDSNGGGDGIVKNIATGDTSQTGSESASASVPVTQRPDLNITKTATVADGATAVDAALDVINYSIVVDNNGNQTLTGVTVSDPRISNLTRTGGDLNSDSKLDVDETWTYTGAYTVTQADIDAGGNILNTATADSSQTPSESASTSVPVTQRPDLDITKTVSSITNPNGTAGGTTVDQVGDVVRYAITVDNNGNQTLTGVTVSDPRISNLSLASGDSDSDSQLDVNETWTYTGAYTVTQADIDNGGNILNTATADSTQTGSESASTSVPVTQNPDLNITKTASVPGGTADVVGEVISYSIVVDNNGNQTLTGVTVS